MTVPVQALIARIDAAARLGDERTIQAKLSQINLAIDRYLAAFEHGTMPADLCRPRLERLHTERDQLQARQQLEDLLATNTKSVPDPAALGALRRRIREVFTRGDGPTRKALLKTLIAEIRVESRDKMRPFFYVPTLTSNNKTQVANRDLGLQVDVTSQNANSPLLVEGPTIRL